MYNDRMCDSLSMVFSQYMVFSQPRGFLIAFKSVPHKMRRSP